ncbi:protein SCO1/2 [Halorientalis persicus]|uniref:Protein SCO1/2 n=1 Tax=Halorientalis persicus TaxID=1367881 RepID=A0A1H8KTR3_9EURY|nr:SCO family protein [Halorientalis persicus]SEN96211.1 protein SCO1/2 [Halorientalis persicus]
MDRRQYLQTALGATAGTAAFAGCLGGGGDGSADQYPNTKLPKQEMAFDAEDVRFPAWGQRIPSATLPRALGDGELSTRGFDKPLALTFIFSNCMTACPLLTQALVSAQGKALDEGWGDAVAFAEITFDPARDTADRLRTYAEERNIALDAGNWTFLRPETEARAKEVVQEGFGVYFEKTDPGSSGTATGSTATDTATGGSTPSTATETATGTPAAEGDGYMFTHRSLILLVNADGYVERFWRGDEATSTAASELPDAMNRLRKA